MSKKNNGAVSTRQAEHAPAGAVALCPRGDVVASGGAQLVMPSPPMPEAEAPRLAGMVNEQWVRAERGRFEFFKFGVMMLVAEQGLLERHLDILPRQNIKTHGGDRKSGMGLHTWLSTFCPNVKYKTAMEYKAYAKAILEEEKIRAETPLLELMGATDEKADAAHEAARERLMKAVETHSLHAMRTAGRMASGKVGKPKGLPPSLPKPVDTSPEAEFARQQERAKLAVEYMAGIVMDLDFFIKEELWDALPQADMRVRIGLVKDRMKSIAAGVEGM